MFRNQGPMGRFGARNQMSEPTGTKARDSADLEAKNLKPRIGATIFRLQGSRVQGPE